MRTANIELNTLFNADVFGLKMYQVIF